MSDFLSHGEHVFFLSSLFLDYNTYWKDVYFFLSRRRKTLYSCLKHCKILRAGPSLLEWFGKLKFWSLDVPIWSLRFGRENGDLAMGRFCLIYHFFQKSPKRASWSHFYRSVYHVGPALESKQISKDEFCHGFPSFQMSTNNNFK